MLALAVAGGVLGTWIVLRGLAFYAHAAGTVAFPGLVLASGLGFAPQLGALAAATALAHEIPLVSVLATGTRTAYLPWLSTNRYGFSRLTGVVASVV